MLLHDLTLLIVGPHPFPYRMEPCRSISRRSPIQISVRSLGIMDRSCLERHVFGCSILYRALPNWWTRSWCLWFLLKLPRRTSRSHLLSRIQDHQERLVSLCWSFYHRSRCRTTRRMGGSWRHHQTGEARGFASPRLEEGLSLDLLNAGGNICSAIVYISLRWYPPVLVFWRILWKFKSGSFRWYDRYNTTTIWEQALLFEDYRVWNNLIILTTIMTITGSKSWIIGITVPAWRLSISSLTSLNILN